MLIDVMAYTDFDRALSVANLCSYFTGKKYRVSRVYGLWLVRCLYIPNQAKENFKYPQLFLG